MIVNISLPRKPDLLPVLDADSVAPNGETFDSQFWAGLTILKGTVIHQAVYEKGVGSLFPG